VKGKHLAVEDQAILGNALRALATGQASTLDEALGVGVRRGVAKVGYRLRKHLRNRMLKQFMERLREEGEMNWSLSVRASDLLRQFEVRVWPRCSDKDIPPNRLSEVQLQLWSIFKVDPKTVRASALYVILNETPDFIE
jgi:hypothetical protein